MTKEEFDKLIGKVVRLRRVGNDVMIVMIVMVLENFADWTTSDWYYCLEEHNELFEKNRVAINLEDVISAEVLPEHESIRKYYNQLWVFLLHLLLPGLLQLALDHTSGFY